ncbi:DUF1090 domain-containing protein [Pseudomonas sp. LS-2]|uniref:DUF1090 domain-containing protein n=1 Tax=Pseudomonas sp. LS-2 TaxID=2315859 RepID=UPI000E728386|nr:DUF1090 domain-containing protein [Pseudomonas sp. LS-2]RJX83042.1 DUF1090 domain-containing protein [Pseudomonas sp. LS-2]
MKFLSPLIAFTACGLLAAPLFAAEQAPELTGCAAKRQDISTQIEQAKAAGNSNQQAGLEKALSEVTANCTDAGLLKEQEKKVLDAKREVSRRQADLDKANSKGDPEKINKRKDKLAESRKELQDEQEKLEKLQPDEEDE